MDKSTLIQQIRLKKSYLCVGLDTDIHKIPVHLQNSADGIVQFNKEIIDATHDLCVSYKINTAFYEQYGASGWDMMKETIAHIPKDILIIADAKRGDIGNTSKYYADAFFTHLKCDAITLSPYMGRDSLSAFFDFSDKWSIVLGLTSNKGADDIQKQKLASGKYVYEETIEKIISWCGHDKLMLVIGATQSSEVANIRKIAPDTFFLVPGVGAQGGDLGEISKAGMIADVGLLINASRSIIYAGNGIDFADMARAEAKKLQEEMEGLLVMSYEL